MSIKSKLLYLFDRPTEPLFMPKGRNNEVFDLPDDYLVERYKPLKDNLLTRFGSDEEKRIPVKKIRVPDITSVTQLGRKDKFSLFIPYHRKLASRLVQIFMGMRNIEDFLSAACYCRDRVNPFLFVYAYSVAILHRSDTKDMDIPPITEIFPAKFVDSRFISKAREETSTIDNSSTRIPIVIPRDYTASNQEIEHRVAYFREDLGINIHHWHWHLVYPFVESLEIVNKDRRGELFYYMHQQILARYNFERLSNKMSRVLKLNLREPIAEGYFSKLDSLTASRTWPPRMSGLKLTDINRSTDQLVFDILDLERWRDRIFAAIHTGAVVDSLGNSIPLTESKGIDILGNILEASILTVNPNKYGDLHNLIHAAIAFIHDPDGRHLESLGVVGDNATGMRDPAFYRLHVLINEIFVEHKDTLPRYNTQQLAYSGVRVSNVEIETNDVALGNVGKNTLFTFWQQTDVDFSRGLDFAPRGGVFARITHLQHSEFLYRIQVDSQIEGMGTVRIFLAPKFDERGLPMLFSEQKNLFIEMDRFTQKLKRGRQIITRKSQDSNITIPFERTFRDVDKNRPAAGSQELQAFVFCGCGWPQHMLVPKGDIGGFPCELFVMISNYKDDLVEDSVLTKPCSDASVYCGIRDTKYPDKRNMGYPFDRQARDGVRTLSQFLTPNMNVVDVSINFSERTVVPKNAPTAQNLE